MRRKWTVGLVVLAAIVAAAATAATVFGGDSPTSRPSSATVKVRMNPAPSAARPSAKKTKKATVQYLQGPATTIDTVVTGPYVDVTLSGGGCKRVVDGGVFPQNTNVYEQGSYVEGKNTYHVLLGFDDEAVISGGVVPFQITSHLICLKGVK
jgi:hypothetical protein